MKHLSIETKRKISNSLKGRISWNKGKELSDEIKRKMSEARKGRAPWNKGKTGVYSDETRRKLSEAGNGKKHSEKTKKKMSEARKGKKNANWQGGITPINFKIRNSKEYALWRIAVFERDNYTCVWCGDNKGGNLNADHIKPFAFYPELRFAIDNGRTLCIPCHKTTDTYLNNIKAKSIK